MYVLKTHIHVESPEAEPLAVQLEDDALRQVFRRLRDVNRIDFGATIQPLGIDIHNIFVHTLYTYVYIADIGRSVLSSVQRQQNGTSQVKPAVAANKQVANYPIRGRIQAFACIRLRDHARVARCLKEVRSCQLRKVAVRERVTFAEQFLPRTHGWKYKLTQRREKHRVQPTSSGLRRRWSIGPPPKTVGAECLPSL